jgi:GDP-L-fucose synthase
MSAMYWENKRFLVTGGAAFLGSHLVKKVNGRGCREFVVPGSKDGDLAKREAILRLRTGLPRHRDSSRCRDGWNNPKPKN